ncbi:hypothetical protein F2Q69_00023308 [Brassica cretica]|uniref:Uncharacterized protein n=1 Tax=Brassica cretica TaxID=69181 RepID=A0A8S9QHD7_BRACR|nr:hypothetical protein F2Q69_00023308 [Brassica cretica]
MYFERLHGSNMRNLDNSPHPINIESGPSPEDRVRCCINSIKTLGSRQQNKDSPPGAISTDPPVFQRRIIRDYEFLHDVRRYVRVVRRRIGLHASTKGLVPPEEGMRKIAVFTRLLPSTELLYPRVRVNRPKQATGLGISIRLMSISGKSTLLRVQKRPMPKKNLEKEILERHPVHAKPKRPATDKLALMPTEASNVSPSGSNAVQTKEEPGKEGLLERCPAQGKPAENEQLWTPASRFLLREARPPTPASIPASRSIKGITRSSDLACSPYIVFLRWALVGWSRLNSSIFRNMEGSPYRKFSISRRKGSDPETEPRKLHSGEPGFLLAGILGTGVLPRDGELWASDDVLETLEPGALMLSWRRWSLEL